MADTIILDDSALVGEWKLDGNANDTSGNGYDGTPLNVVYTKTDRDYQSQCGVFNGSSSYMDASLPSQTVNGAQFVSFNVRRLGNGNGTYNGLVQFQNGASIARFALWIGPSNVLYVFNSDGVFQSTGYVLQLNIDTHIVFGRTGSQMKLYVDGVSVYTVSSSGNDGSNTINYIRLGCRENYAEFSNVNIQTVRIFNAALSEKEIRNRYLHSLRMAGGSSLQGIMDKVTACYDFKGDANDIIGGHDASVTGASLTSDRFGTTNSAYRFSGNDYVTLPSELNVANDISIIQNVKIPAVSGPCFGIRYGFLQVTPTYCESYWYNFNGGNQVSNLYGNHGKSVGDYVQIAYVKSSVNGAKLYVDGILAASDGANFNGYGYAGGPWIGQTAQNGFSTKFSSDIDDTIIYLGEFSDTEIKRIYDITSKSKILPFDVDGRKGLPRQLKSDCKLWLTGDSDSGNRSLVSRSLYSDPSLVRYYSLNDLTEKSGNTLTNSGCTSVVGKFGTAYSTGANNDANGMYNTTNVGIDGGPVTIAAWIKTLSNHKGNHSYNFAVWESSPVNYVINGITFNKTNTTVSFARLRSVIAWEGATASFSATPGVWNHYAMTYDGGTVRGYINGSLVASGPSSGYGATDTFRAFGFGIGNNVVATNEDSSSVEVDDAAVFSRALSDSEISELYGVGMSFDASGKGNHAIPVNSPVKKRHHGYSGMSFDGTSYMYRTDAVGIDDHYTLACSVKMNAELGGGDAMFMHLSNTVGGNIFDVAIQYHLSGGTLYLGHFRNKSGGALDYVDVPYAIGTEKFSRIAITFDGSYCRTYVNGRKISEFASSGFGTNPSVGTHMSVARYWNGNSTYSRPNAQIFNPIAESRALTDYEIKMDAINFFIP